MSDSNGLGLEALRAASRLIHELCELGRDPVQWNTHLLQSMEQMLHAQVGSAYVIRRDFDSSNFTDAFQLHHNANDAWTRYVEAGDLRDQPHTPAMMARPGTDFTVTRQELVDDAAWYASGFYKTIAVPANFDQAIFSQVMIQSIGCIHGLGFARALGGQRFGQRETTLLNFVHAELAHLWRKPEAVEIDSLSKRLRETIGCMQRGLGRKDMADEMGISPHTVQTYERQLYDKFNVTSRGELLARLAKAIRPTLPV
jgi:DNA-binding CsgD family transcriptional regulator